VVYRIVNLKLVSFGDSGNNLLGVFYRRYPEFVLLYAVVSALMGKVDVWKLIFRNNDHLMVQLWKQMRNDYWVRKGSLVRLFWITKIESSKMKFIEAEIELSLCPLWYYLAIQKLIQKPQGGGPSGEGPGLGGMLPTRSKVQYLLGAFNPLGPLDWGNLIAPWITWGALAGNSLLRACAPPGLVGANASDTQCQ
jgi:hypothetical protein